MIEKIKNPRLESFDTRKRMTELRKAVKAHVKHKRLHWMGPFMLMNPEYDSPHGRSLVNNVYNSVSGSHNVIADKLVSYFNEFYLSR